MKPALFHPAAEREMIDAAAWYETQQTNLGKRFLASVQDTINRLKLQPNLYSLVENDVRRCLTKTFPFGVPITKCLSYSLIVLDKINSANDNHIIGI